MERSLSVDSRLPEVGTAQRLTCWRAQPDQMTEQETLVPRELPLTIYLNGQELVTVMCTPHNLNSLVLGLLYCEGLISSLKEVTYLRVCPEEGVAEARLSRADLQLPQRRVLTSGCGGGSSFQGGEEKTPPIDSGLRLSIERVVSLARKLQEAAGPRCGLHTSALSDGQDLLVVAQDIGRHNTLDKIVGQCLLAELPFKDRVLLTTGRLFSEMALKAARMATPVVISRNSPTEYAIGLAQRLGITLIGYARGSRFSIYSHPGRIAD